MHALLSRMQWHVLYTLIPVINPLSGSVQAFLHNLRTSGTYYLLQLLILLTFLSLCHALPALPCACFTVVPPGHYDHDGSTEICPDGTYRAEWLIKASAQACVSCGKGVSAEPTEQVTVPTNLNDPSSTPVLRDVRTSAASCCKCTLLIKEAVHSACRQLCTGML